MPLTEPEWNSIAQFTEKIVKQVIGTRGDFFVTGKVIKVDTQNRCVYLAEFGDQAVPVVGFNYTASYYVQESGSMTKKTATAEIQMPKVGQSVLVAREMGTSRLPRALGVIQGKNWIVSEEE
jgi:hypothetical protein